MARCAAFPALSGRLLGLGQLASTLLLACLLVAPATAAEADEVSALATIQRRGVMTVALYKEFPPFSDDGGGIDFDLAAALAAKLGVKLSPLWFDAGEKVENDLRNMVWKGHPIGIGPADLMMHAPVDSEYMARVKQVAIFAPYHRERYAFGRQLSQLPLLASLEPFAKLSFAVEDETMAEQVMLSADNGRYRETLKPFKTGAQAVAALKSGRVPAALAQQGELEAGVGADPAFAIDLPPHPVLGMRQWALGLAVKAESVDLARALQAAMNELMADGTVSRIMQRHGVVHRRP